VPHRHVNGVPARLLTHPVDHVLGLFDAIHAHSRPGKRQGDTTGADGELQRVGPAGEPGKERDGLALVAAAVTVIPFRNVVTETRPGVEPFHVVVPSGCSRRLWPQPMTQTCAATWCDSRIRAGFQTPDS